MEVLKKTTLGNLVIKAVPKALAKEMIVALESSITGYSGKKPRINV